MTTEKSRSRSLPCPLTDAEVAYRADKLANLVREMHAMEAEKRAEAQRFKTAIEEHDAAIEALATQVRTRTEYRTVECQEQLRGSLVDTVRCDTGEIVERRPASKGELQQSLFGEKVD